MGLRSAREFVIDRFLDVLGCGLFSFSTLQLVGQGRFRYKWDYVLFMKEGKEKYLLHLDKKGRVHLPIALREKMGAANEVVAETENGLLVLRPLARIDDPVKFLAELQIKTKKTPLEMKREAEEGFFS